MFDPFDPLDPRDYLFGTGYPFEGQLDPMNNQMDPFSGSIENMGGEFVTSPVPYEPVPGTASPGEPMARLPGVVDDVMEEFDSGSELIEPYQVLDGSPGSGGQVKDPIGVRSGLPGELKRPLLTGMPEDMEHLGREFEILEPAMEFKKMLEYQELEANPFDKMKPDLDAVGMEEFTNEGCEHSQNSCDYKLLDEFEASIEQGEAPGSGSGEKKLSNKPEYWTKAGPSQIEDENSEKRDSEKIMGVSSPDLKIIDEPKRIYDRQFKPKLWRPRGYSGIRKSQLSKSKKKSEKRKGDKNKARVRECPRKQELVALAECESCQFFKDGECTWNEDKDIKEIQEELE